VVPLIRFDVTAIAARPVHVVSGHVVSEGRL
jgi:hypothetical protein